MVWVPVQISQLRIGHFIRLDHGWFAHPFARNTFLISSQSEIEIIRRRKLHRICFDPDRSSLANENQTDPLLETSAAKEPDAALLASIDAELDALDSCKTEAMVRARLQLDTLSQVSEHFAAQIEVCNQSIELLRRGRHQGYEGLTEVAAKLIADSGNGHSCLTAASAEGEGPLRDSSIVDALSGCAIAIMTGRRLKLDEMALQQLAVAALANDSKIPNRVLQDTIGSYERLLGAIGCYHELTGNGPGRESLMPAEAIARMFRTRQHEFGRETLESLIATVSVYPPGTYLDLADETLCRVMRINAEKRLLPLVRVVRGPGDVATDGQDDDVELIDLAAAGSPKVRRALAAWEVAALIPSVERQKTTRGFAAAAWDDAAI